MRPKLLMDMDEPKCDMSNTATVEDKRAKLRREIAAPK
jgi:hypothetical protein